MLGLDQESMLKKLSKRDKQDPEHGQNDVDDGWTEICTLTLHAFKNDSHQHWINTNPNTTNSQIRDFFGFQYEYR